MGKDPLPGRRYICVLVSLLSGIPTQIESEAIV
jgi:hypothetical protein